MQQYSLTAITQVDPHGPTKLEKFRQEHLTRKSDQPLLPLLLEARNAFATNDRDKSLLRWDSANERLLALCRITQYL